MNEHWAERQRSRSRMSEKSGANFPTSNALHPTRQTCPVLRRILRNRMPKIRPLPANELFKAIQFFLSRLPATAEQPFLQLLGRTSARREVIAEIQFHILKNSKPSSLPKRRICSLKAAITSSCRSTKSLPIQECIAIDSM